MRLNVPSFGHSRLGIAARHHNIPHCFFFPSLYSQVLEVDDYPINRSLPQQTFPSSKTLRRRSAASRSRRIYPSAFREVTEPTQPWREVRSAPFSRRGGIPPRACCSPSESRGRPVTGAACCLQTKCDGCDTVRACGQSKAGREAVQMVAVFTETAVAVDVILSYISIYK